MTKGPSIKDVSNEVGEVKIWSKFANCLIGKSTDMGRGVSKIWETIPTSFMDGSKDKQYTHYTYIYELSIKFKLSSICIFLARETLARDTVYTLAQ